MESMFEGGGKLWGADNDKNGTEQQTQSGRAQKMNKFKEYLNNNSIAEFPI